MEIVSLKRDYLRCVRRKRSGLSVCHKENSIMQKARKASNFEGNLIKKWWGGVGIIEIAVTMFQSGEGLDIVYIAS